MLSGVGPADHLAEFGIPVVKDLPGLGQNLRDHPMLSVTWKTKEGYAQDPFAPRGQMVMRWTSEGGEVWNDLMMFMISFATQRVDRGGNRMTPIGIRMLPVLDLAVGAGELRLVSTDPHTPPFLDYRYLEDERDLSRMREMVRLAIKFSEHPAFEPIIESRIEPTEEEAATQEGLDAYILREISTGQHSSGTCKMGPVSDPLAVVDQ
jgi:choline dehydrogenase